MNRKALRGAGLALLAGVVLAWSGSYAADDKKGKTASISEIMKKAHGGSKSLLSQINEELKSKEPNWRLVQERSKELTVLGAALGRNNPPKGDKTSWDKLTKAYVQDATGLEKAARSMDLAASNTAFKKLRGGCKGCHNAHKEDE